MCEIVECFGSGGVVRLQVSSSGGEGGRGVDGATEQSVTRSGNSSVQQSLRQFLITRVMAGFTWTCFDHWKVLNQGVCSRRSKPFLASCQEEELLEAPRVPIGRLGRFETETSVA